MSLASARAAHKAKPKVKKTPKVPLPTPTPEPGEKKGRGRPSAYSPEIADRLCERIAMREPLSKITRDDDMPCEATIYKWRLQIPEFAEKVARAREHRAMARADYMDEVVDDVRIGKLDPQAGRVVLESERWQAGKEMPKVFGDRISADLTTNGQSLYLASDLDIAKALAHALAVPALPAPEPIDVEAVPVSEEGEQP